MVSITYNSHFKIWRPDIVLYNNVGDKIEVNTLIQVIYITDPTLYDMNGI